MWRGLIREVARALRHGLVASGLCVLFALGTGVSGYLFSERPAVYAEVALPEQPGATSSQQVLSRVLRPWTTAETAAPPAVVASVAASIGGDAEAPLPPAPAVQAAPQLVEQAITPELRTPEVRATAEPQDGSADVVRAHRTAPPASVLVPGDRARVTVSFYYCEESAGGFPVGDGGGFCGRGRDGSMVRSGMAACDYAYLGQRFRIVGDPIDRIYVCADTGSAVRGMHRDIWFLDNRSGWGWQSQVGATATIEILP